MVKSPALLPISLGAAEENLALFKEIGSAIGIKTDLRSSTRTRMGTNASWQGNRLKCPNQSIEQLALLALSRSYA